MYRIIFSFLLYILFLIPTISNANPAIDKVMGWDSRPNKDGLNYSYPFRGIEVGMTLDNAKIIIKNNLKQSPELKRKYDEMRSTWKYDAYLLNEPYVYKLTEYDNIKRFDGADVITMGICDDNDIGVLYVKDNIIIGIQRNVGTPNYMCAASREEAEEVIISDRLLLNQFGYNILNRNIDSDEDVCGLGKKAVVYDPPIIVK